MFQTDMRASHICYKLISSTFMPFSGDSKLNDITSLCDMACYPAGDSENGW